MKYYHGKKRMLSWITKENERNRMKAAKRYKALFLKEDMRRIMQEAALFRKHILPRQHYKKKV